MNEVSELIKEMIRKRHELLNKNEELVKDNVILRRKNKELEDCNLELLSKYINSDGVDNIKLLIDDNTRIEVYNIKIEEKQEEVINEIEKVEEIYNEDIENIDIIDSYGDLYDESDLYNNGIKLFWDVILAILFPISMLLLLYFVMYLIYLYDPQTNRIVSMILKEINHTINFIL